MRAVSLFSGVGGLDLAVAEVFGAHPVAFAELDPNASKVLAARWPGVPNVGDVTAARWEDWEGVDVLHGGPPCQPTSSAGKRQGENDERWMWPAALDALRRVRPRWVVWENPSALLGLGGGVPFGRILGEMAALGYVGSYGCLRASDVGACHQRDRLWIVAVDAEGGGWGRRRVRLEVGDEARGGRAQAVDGGRGARVAHGRRRQEGGVQLDGGTVGPRLKAPRRDDADRRRAATPDAESGDDQEPTRDPWPQWIQGANRRSRSAAPDATSDAGRLSDGDGGSASNATDERRERLRDARGRRGRPADDGGIAWGDYAPAIDRAARLAGRPAPAPVDERGRLSAPFVEWMQVLPDGWVTDVLPRNPALKALGNCVVPPCAVAAMRLLRARLETGVAA